MVKLINTTNNDKPGYERVGKVKRTTNDNTNPHTILAKDLLVNTSVSQPGNIGIRLKLD